ncbi:MAG: cytochrome c [Xanthobacteraceae bacterium]|nr:cytochrome c [Xanthobacteraceae bacterium]
MLDRMLRVAAFVIIAASVMGAQRSVAEDNAKIAAGETVYNTYCATCHGDNLVSSGQTFDLRKLPADARPRFENSVLKGKGQMPPWQGVLSSDEIDQLWHYIRDNAHEK